MKPNSIHLSIRRDRNGYFSARIHADGKEITRVPYQYGCGSYPFAIALVAAREEVLDSFEDRSAALEYAAILNSY